ncbi:MAG: metal-dependent transcriptional regulator [Candidatus Sumerlaeia bacterium]|nr:metal-dependent transcriptional regulator [Candidatus Sumerlaeia bacterium]
MPLSDRAEDLLEQLWIKTQEEGKKVISLEELQLTVQSEELKELLALNYVTVTTEGVNLNKEGLKEAENAIRRHRLAERLMLDVLDLKEELMEDSACRFEHLIHKDMEESICTILGHPRFCPHGKPIPQGKCCKVATKIAQPVFASIADVNRGVKGKVAYLHTRDKKKLQKFLAMGILPGVTIEVIQRFPSYVLQVGHTQVAMDEEMARDIFVRIGKEHLSSESKK